jgi:hypothetical protein
MADPVSTPSEYRTGVVKQNPDTLAVAVRTNLTHPQGALDWGVMTVDNGGHYANWNEVQDWADMVTS